MKSKYLKKIIKDNSLNLNVRGRSNGIHLISEGSNEDIQTLQELLNGMGYSLKENTVVGYYLMKNGAN